MGGNLENVSANVESTPPGGNNLHIFVILIVSYGNRGQQVTTAPRGDPFQ